MKLSREICMGIRGSEGETPGKPPPRPQTRRERGDAMGRGWHKGGDKEVGGKNVPVKPWECEATTGAARPPEWPTIPPE